MSKPIGPNSETLADSTRPLTLIRGADWRYVRKDRLPIPTVLLVMAILAMTIADGVLTILLLDHHFEEANPLMRCLLGIHPLAFVIGKYALTAFWLPFFLIFGRCQVFLPGFRVSHLLPLIVLLYFALLVYQVTLILSL